MQILQIKVICKVNASFIVITVPIQQCKLIKKLHVNGLEAMQSDIDSVTTENVMLKGHF